MPSFTRTRDVELSLLFYLESSVNADWSDITVVKTFKQVYSTTIDLPIICVHLAETNPINRQEIGSDTLEERFLLNIAIFSTSDGQRLDLADYITSKLSTGWTHYLHSHSSGSNTELSRVASGRDKVSAFITNEKIDPTDTIDPKDRHRHNITIQVKTSATS